MMRFSRLFLVALLGLSAVATTSSAAPVKASPGASAGSAASARTSTTRRLAEGELTSIVQNAISSSNVRMPKGATIAGVRSTTTSEIPKVSSRISIEMTPPPRKAGKVTANGVLLFWKDTEVSARVPVTLELSVPAEAMIFDVPKGGALSLVIRRGLVEVTAPAVASADGDVGDIIQVLLRPSGRAIRAQIVAKERAVMVDEVR